MPETIYWHDQKARQALLERGRTVLSQIRDRLPEGVLVAIEPNSGTYFVAETLGRANALAYTEFPDQWLYFARTDDPSAEIVLPTW